MSTTLSHRPQVTPPPGLGEIRRAMHHHVLAVSSMLPRATGWDELRDHCRTLLSGDLFTFAASTIREEALLVHGRHAPASRRRLFRDWLVAVSVLPWSAPGHPGRYLALLAGLSEPAYEHPEGRHVAHWMAFDDGGELTVRLTVIPNHRVSAAPLLLPVDLLAPAERKLLRLPAAA
ncbi:MAG TPA: hypothetical protein VF058_10740 [Actinomycetota bacterium]